MSYVTTSSNRYGRRAWAGFGDGPCPAGQVWNFASGQCEPDPAANPGGNLTYCLQHPDEPQCATPTPGGGPVGPDIPLPGKKCPPGTASGPDGSCTPITPAAIAAACKQINGWLDRHGNCYAGPAPGPNTCGKGAFPVADKMSPGVLGCECEAGLYSAPDGGVDCVTLEQYCAHYGEQANPQDGSCRCKQGQVRPSPGQDCVSGQKPPPPPEKRVCPPGTTGQYPNCVAVAPAPQPKPAPNRAWVWAAVGGGALLLIAGVVALDDPKKRKKKQQEEADARHPGL